MVNNTFTKTYFNAIHLKVFREQLTHVLGTPCRLGNQEVMRWNHGGWKADMDKENCVFNGEFSLGVLAEVLSEGICICCRCILSYCVDSQILLAGQAHIGGKDSPPCSPKQTALDSLQHRCPASKTAKWVWQLANRLTSWRMRVCLEIIQIP